MGVSLSKEEAVKKISLRKEKVVSLSKEKNLEGVRARVALVLDFSGSMDGLFKNGTVQDVIERLVPLALNFDDNGTLDFWIFDNGFHRLDGITLDNFYGLADRVRKKYHMGGTRYSPVIKDVDKYYIKEEPENIPNYVIFITDGDNSSSDKEPAEKALITASAHPIFFQFIGVGNSRFAFLEELDDLRGRVVDNANFFSVDKIDEMSDDDLYTKLFKEFPSWLKLDKVQEMLKDVSSLSKKKGFFSRLLG